MTSRLTDTQLDVVIVELKQVKHEYCEMGKHEMCNRMSRIIKKFEEQKKDRA